MKTFVKIAALAALAGPCLHAGGFSWSIKAGVTAPVGAMKEDDRLGTHRAFGGSALSLGFSWQVGAADGIRLRFDGQSMRQGEPNPVPGASPEGSVFREAAWYIPEVGLDWRHRWGQAGRWYTVAGAGLAFPKLDVTTFFKNPGGPELGSTSSYRQDRRLDLRLGGGYELSRRWFAEAGFHALKARTDGPDGYPFGTLTWFEVGAGIRFGAAD